MCHDKVPELRSLGTENISGFHINYNDTLIHKVIMAFTWSYTPETSVIISSILFK